MNQKENKYFSLSSIERQPITITYKDGWLMPLFNRWFTVQNGSGVSNSKFTILSDKSYIFDDNIIIPKMEMSPVDLYEYVGFTTLTYDTDRVNVTVTITTTSGETLCAQPITFYLERVNTRRFKFYTKNIVLVKYDGEFSSTNVTCNISVSSTSTPRINFVYSV